ncbi:tetratricopeptide repeat protein [Kribbella sandramycini]|uniref:Tetratricopeptide (TPR) repeat protein n=1 Tax=Kribbella sandramycini TaxID=60450 RepID=A0A7Y4L795_9ACTN|nr:tetratricopeptide repeat protein [Kribbella sandramycini]MBB6570192.1 tetratricopeptide (TPR) repeat protein [Kribbella sandramycini]NOL45683.1 tetratricopeptide repeat protein [Kribbella sandramycini]
MVGEIAEFGSRLQELRAWSGVSYRELHRRIVRSRTARGVAEIPAYDTVYRCLQPGRCRLDVELVVDVVRALIGETDEEAVLAWRHAYQLASGAASDAAVVNVTDRLPDDLELFTGRAEELAVLRRLSFERSAPVVVAVAGMAGVGKTRLAVHAAHRLVGVDQVLAVNLRGFDPRDPAEPGAVLEAFLRLLGVRVSRAPGAEHSARTAKLGEVLRGRRSVILLDNAASAEQVLPLLPGVPGSVVVVTSRRRLDLPGAQALQLGPFTPAESDELLRKAVGDRVRADPATAGRIAVQMGQLPLALALVAGRIDASPDWSLTDHLERLVERGRIRCLDDAVENALAQSYSSLPPARRTLLRMLALHPGTDFDSSAAAVLAGVPDTTDLLDELVAGNLLQQRAPGRYEMHDLVRVYAAKCGSDEDPASARRAALTRLVDHYRAVAATAMAAYAPHEPDWRPRVRPSVVPLVDPSSRDAALTWLESERTNLVASGLLAAEHELPAHAAELSSILYRYLDDAGHYADGEALHSAAARVAPHAVRGRVLSSLGVVRWRLGKFAEAREVYAEALRMATAAGDDREQIRALINLGLVLERVGAYSEAHANYLQAIDISATINARLPRARALHNAVLLDERLGRYETAYERVQECLTILRETGDRVTEGRALNSRAAVSLSLGRVDQARADAEHAITIAREVANRTGEAYALITLGRALGAIGALEPAQARLELALQIAIEVANRDAEALALNESGLVASAAGAPASALDLHRTALAVAEETGDPYERARSHQGCARALLLLGNAAAAQSELRLALVLFGELRTPEARIVATDLAALSA